MAKFTVAAGSEDLFKQAGGAGRPAQPFDSKLSAALQKSYDTGKPVRFATNAGDDMAELRREITRWGRANGKGAALRPLKHDASATEVHVKVGDVKYRAKTPEGAAPAQSPQEQPAS